MSSITDLWLKLCIYCLDADNCQLSLTPIVMHFKHVALARTVSEAFIFCVYNCISSAEMWLSDLKKKKDFWQVSTSTLYFFHLQLYELRLQNILEFGEPFIVQILWVLPLISLLYKTSGLFSLGPGLHQDPASWSSSSEYIQQVGKKKKQTTSPSRKLTTHLFRSCLDSSTDSWGALSFQIKESKEVLSQDLSPNTVLLRNLKKTWCSSTHCSI